MARRPLRAALTLLTALGVCSALTVGPASAVVTAGSSDGDTVTITSNGDADTMSLACTGGNATVNLVAVAPTIACSAVETVTVGLGGGMDTLNLGGATAATFPALTRVTVDAEDGLSDTVTGSAARDVVTADPFDIVATGPGNDRIEGGQTADGGDGNDLLTLIQGSAQGGPGNDRIVNPGGGPLDGGSGFDTVEVDFTAIVAEIAIDIDVSDAAIDIGSDVVVGSLAMAAVEEVVLTYTDGDRADSFDSRTFSGRVVVRTLNGNDTVLAGPGSDVLDGGNGNDVLNPGAGPDVARGGDGADTLTTRDASPDVVDCGPGIDTVTADRADAVVNCETVLLPPPDTGKVVGPKKLTKGAKGTYTLSSSVAGARFECRIDAGSFKACRSTFTVRTKKLSLGKHKLVVRAVQPVGNVDPTPARFGFKVLARRR